MLSIDNKIRKAVDEAVISYMPNQKQDIKGLLRWTRSLEFMGWRA